MSYLATASIACPVDGSCIAVNQDGLATTLSGGEWSNPDWGDNTFTLAAGKRAVGTRSPASSAGSRLGR